MTGEFGPLKIGRVWAAHTPKTAEDVRYRGLKGIAVFAFKEYLTTSELDLFATNVNRVAGKCFNISPERAGAVTAWLTRQNQTSLRNVTQVFGPMKARFVRDITSEGSYYTAVYLSRSGIPGASPWLNYCTQ